MNKTKFLNTLLVILQGIKHKVIADKLEYAPWHCRSFVNFNDMVLYSEYRWQRLDYRNRSAENEVYQQIINNY